MVVGWYRAAVAWGGSRSVRFHTPPCPHSDHDLLPSHYTLTHTHTHTHTDKHTHMCITTPLEAKILTQANTYTHIQYLAFRKTHKNTNGWNRIWHQSVCNACGLSHVRICLCTIINQNLNAYIHVWVNFSSRCKVRFLIFFSLPSNLSCHMWICGREVQHCMLCALYDSRAL